MYMHPAWHGLAWHSSAPEDSICVCWAELSHKLWDSQIVAIGKMYASTHTNVRHLYKSRIFCRVRASSRNDIFFYIKNTHASYFNFCSCIKSSIFSSVLCSPPMRCMILVLDYIFQVFLSSSFFLSVGSIPSSSLFTLVWIRALQKIEEKSPMERTDGM